MVAARSGYVKGGVPVRTPPFLSGIFPPRHFQPRHFQPRHFSVPTLSAPAFCFAAALLSCMFADPGRREGWMFVRERRRSSGWEIARSLWEGRSLGRKKRGARWEKGGPLVREGKAVWSEGTPSGAGRLGRWGGHPVAGTALRGEFPAKGCLRSRIGGPNDTNRIKNTRFGLPFNEKFGMFVHMNRIRLAEVTLIGHATGSLSGPCAGRGTGGENIWCFMSPAR